MHIAKKILATLLPTGILLVGSAGLAAADTSTTTNINWWTQTSSSSSGAATDWNGWMQTTTSDMNINSFDANTFGHNEVPPVPDMTPGYIKVMENSTSSSTSSLRY